MEKNSLFFKALAIVLIAILGLNVYRTETTKLEVSHLSEKIGDLSARIDSLKGEKPASGAFAVTRKQFANISKSVSTLESKVNALQNSVEQLSKAKSQTQPSVSGKEVTTPGIHTETSVRQDSNPSSSVRVSVTAKVRVENRYVSGTAPMPKVSTGPVGQVVINVAMDIIGIVGSVSVNKATTISDEDIIEACKEAALKTSFGYNPDAPAKSTGTITYIFSAR